MTLHRTSSPISTSLLSRAVEIGASRNLVMISAQMPPVVNPSVDPQSLEAFGDTRQQTLGCLGRVAGVLQELQLTLEDLVGARVYRVADPRIGRMDFEGFNAAWSEFFGQRATRFPSRTVLQVAGLVNAGWLLEIEPLAARERA